MPNLDVTFSQQAKLWLRELAMRKRKPVSPATLSVFGSYVRRLTPMIGEMKLADINNGTLKQLVQRLDQENLSAKTINELVAVVEQVVATLVDQETGESILKREWSARFIDCPTITTQKQPCATREDVERCITNVKSDQEKLLYAVLAGSGLRIAEALAIHVNSSKEGTSWNPDIQAIELRSSIFNGREILRLKTTAAKRTVDLDPQLNDLITMFVEMNRIQPGNYLFQARSDRPMHLKTARERLAKHAIPGFHSFRRFRITRLRELGIPEDLLRYWVGHSGKGITDRYSKLAENISSLTPALDRAFTQLYEAFSGPKAFDLREFHDAVFEFLDKGENSPTSHDTYFNNFTILWTGYQNSGHFDHAEAVWEMALKPVLRWEHDHPGTFVHKGTPFYFWGMTAILRGEIDRGYLFMHRSVKEDERTNPRNYQKSPGFYFALITERQTKHSDLGSWSRHAS